ncbi:MAG: phage major capsid protein [Bacteroidales bacterium]|nr:phage major capsid protein [Bacteroidales bacterium]
MRTNIAEIQKDLLEAANALKSVDLKDQAAVDAAEAKVTELTRELDLAKKADAAERLAVAQHLQKEEKKGHAFSIIRFLNGAMPGATLDGLEAEMAAEGARELQRSGIAPKGLVIPAAVFTRSASGQNAGTSADGGNLVITGQHYVDEVSERLTVFKMGATVLTDLVGNVDLPSVGGVTFAFVNEGVSTSTTKKAAVAKATLSPKGIRGHMAVTRDLLAQSSLNVEQILKDRIVAAEAACIDKAALAAIVSAASSAGTSFTFASLVAMETAINSENANRGKMGYILTAADWGLAKVTQKASGFPAMILEPGNMINSYKADFSNQFAANTPVFGNFEDLFIGRWGGVEILVDPFTMADTGEIKLQLFSYADVKVALAKSFSKLVIA